MINQQLLGSVQAASCKPDIPKLAATSFKAAADQHHAHTQHTQDK